MKKTILLMAVIFCLFAFSTSFAQVPETLDLAPIDETAAADFLGTWYLRAIAVEGEELSMTGMGFHMVCDLAADNSGVMSTVADSEAAEDVSEDEAFFWELGENGAIFHEDMGEGEFKAMEAVIDENGEMRLADPDGEMIFSRELKKLRGEADAKTDAVFADFEGSWKIIAVTGAGMRFPASLIGMDDYTAEFVEEGKWTMTSGGTVNELEYTVDENGMLTSVMPGEDGAEDTTFFITLTEDNTLLITSDVEEMGDSTLFMIPADEAYEEDESSLMSLFAMLGEAFSEEDLAEEVPAE